MKASEYAGRILDLIAAHGDLECVSDGGFGYGVAGVPRVDTWVQGDDADGEQVTRVMVIG